MRRTAVLPVVIAVLSALCIAVGVGMVFLPAGIVTAGVLGMCGAYVAAYLGKR